MNRTLLWTVVSLLTFGLGIAIAFAWLGGRGNAIGRVDVLAEATSETFAVPSDMPILAYCELANNPEKYDGRIVRVSARLWYTKHGYFFLSKNCYGDAKQAGVTAPYGNRWQEIETKIAKDLGFADADYTPWEFPEIIAVGRFRRVQPTGKSDAVFDNTPLLFEIISVERASNIKAE